MATVEFENVDELALGFNLTPRGLYTHGPAPGRIGVVDFDGGRFDRTSEITLENLQAMLQHVSGTNVTLKSVQVATSYTDRARQATTYRQGRILLAGDAAHVHSPFGGQGMNTGLGDAMNLGWKLAATIKGWAPDALLDTYTAERHPIGEWVLNWTRAQVAIIRPDPHARAIASVVRDLIDTKAGTNYFIEKISGISLHYDLGGGHPLVGRSAPDFDLEGGKRLGDLLHDGRGLLLDFTGSESLGALCSGREDRLQYVASHAKDEKGLAALLVRPDGFVAWATDARARYRGGRAIRPALVRSARHLVRSRMHQPSDFAIFNFPKLNSCPFPADTQASDTNPTRDPPACNRESSTTDQDPERHADLGPDLPSPCSSLCSRNAGRFHHAL